MIGLKAIGILKFFGKGFIFESISDLYNVFVSFRILSHKKQNGLCSGSPLKRDTHSNLVCFSFQ